MTAGSQQGTGSDRDQNDVGVAYRHAYTIQDTKEEDGVRMIKLRNPWGAETYHGPYSDKTNDGEWWTTADIFHRSFSMTWGNPDVKDQHMTYFARFDVETPEEIEERMTFISPVDQTVYISAYTYDTQHIRNGACDQTQEGSYLYFIDDKTNEWIYPFWGYNHVQPINMKAGERIGGRLQAYWVEGDLMAHDYSVVVFGEKEPVTIEMANGGDTINFPQYRLSANVVNLNGDSSSTDDGSSTGDGDSNEDEYDDPNKNEFSFPHTFWTSDEVLENNFHFAENDNGANYMESKIEVTSADRLEHKITFTQDGTPYEYKVDVFYDGETFSATITDQWLGNDYVFERSA